MDPVTHAVIGLSLSKIAGNGTDFSNPAVVGIVVGSVFPDIDIILQKWGDYVYLKNHRGVTHSILGILITSALIALVFTGIYENDGFLKYFTWIFAGCMSHTIIDLFNSYGAKILWPFSNKKFSLSLLIIFDPILIGVLGLYIFAKGELESVSIVTLVIYLISRVLMRFLIDYEFRKRSGKKYEKISILPSMTGLFRWHLILESQKYNLIGEKDIFKRGIKILQKYNKIEDRNLAEVLFSPVGKFFREFTPLYHITCEKADNIKRYVFIDMRYYMKNKFLHHAILEMDDVGNVIKSSFNPYSINRINHMPLE